jgi:hypothetical protein
VDFSGLQETIKLH